MHRFDADVEDLEAYEEELFGKMEKAVEPLTEEELEVYGILADTLTPNPRNDDLAIYPEDFFRQSVDALNAHFGSSQTGAITENVRLAILATHLWAMADDDLWEPWLSETEPEEKDWKIKTAGILDPSRVAGNTRGNRKGDANEAVRDQRGDSESHGADHD